MILSSTTKRYGYNSVYSFWNGSLTDLVFELQKLVHRSTCYPILYSEVRFSICGCRMKTIDKKITEAIEKHGSLFNKVSCVNRHFQIVILKLMIIVCSQFHPSSLLSPEKCDHTREERLLEISEHPNQSIDGFWYSFHNSFLGKPRPQIRMRPQCMPVY